MKLRQPAFETSAPKVINLAELDAESAPQPPSMATLKRIIDDEI